MKAAQGRRREGVFQRGASGVTDKTPWRWQARGSVHAGQCRMAWLKVSSSFTQAGQIFEKGALNKKGWAAR